ncbi:MAG: hypothetical protein KDB56_03720 [Mycobacterium sp.]|nr:hypothetical protein [Mycobacterium sp.]
MDLSALQHVLIWALVTNYVILLVWFAVFRLAHDWMYRVHTQWFRLSRESFDALHYGGMAVYKIGIFLFILGPLIGVALAG